MKKLFCCLTLAILVLACKKDEERQPLPADTIELDGKQWDFNTPCSWLFGWGSPLRYEYSLKINGADGSCLFIQFSLPSTALDSLPRTVVGGFHYYETSGFGAFKYGTTPDYKGSVEILSIDTDTKKMAIRLEAELNGADGKMQVASGELKNISCRTFGEYSAFDVSAQKNNQEFQISEMGFDEGRGYINWFFYTHDFQGDLIFFKIPWHTQPGTYALGQNLGDLISLPSYPPEQPWKLISGQLNLEENDFCDGRQAGHFNAIFARGDNNQATVEFNDVRFEIDYNE
jgi:hypothetical protein